MNAVDGCIQRIERRLQGGQIDHTLRRGIPPMSRGLGRRQQLLLRILSELDVDHPNHVFKMSLIVARLYSSSPDLQQRHRTEVERGDAFRAEMKSLAVNGDRDAKTWLMLDDSIRSWSTSNRRRGRKCERLESSPRSGRVPRSVESNVNPSRCMRALVARGLARGGRGWFGLTELGRGVPHCSDT